MLRVTWIGLRTYRHDMATAGARLEKALRANLGIAAKLVERSTKHNVKARLNRSGRSTGDTYRSINSRVMKGRIGLFAVVGPYRERKGNLLRIHEEGLTVMRAQRKGGAKHPARYQKTPVIEPAVRKHSETVFRLLGRSFDVI